MNDQYILSTLHGLPETLKWELIRYMQELVRVHEQQQTQSQRKPRVPGSAKGKYRMSEDFDEPLEDFKDYM